MGERKNGRKVLISPGQLQDGELPSVPGVQETSREEVELLCLLAANAHWEMAPLVAGRMGGSLFEDDGCWNM